MVATVAMVAAVATAVAARREDQGETLLLKEVEAVAQDLLPRVTEELAPAAAR